MDQLTYAYQANSNKLTIVSDAGNDTFGFKDDQIGTGTDTTIDYTYDVNGNLKTDSNKAITNISYNHLNLPVVINFGSTNKIEYIYDATGVKLQKKVTSGTTITTDYAGNYIYENGNLQFFNQPEGYVEPINASNYNLGFKYAFQYKDHLGNIRLSYTDADGNGIIATSEIVEENNYYPFGLKHKGYNGNIIGRHHKYMFGGKELQDEILGSNSFEVYDFGARNYDAALGRWMNLDPLAEKMRRHSPYIYAFNNPIYFIDPDGMEPIVPPGSVFGLILGVRNLISKTVETIKNSNLTVYNKSVGLKVGKLGGGINVQSKEVFSFSFSEGYQQGSDNTSKSGYQFDAGVFGVSVSESKTVETKDINIQYSSPEGQTAIVPGIETSTKTVNEGTVSVLGFGGIKSKTTMERNTSQTMGNGSSLSFKNDKVVIRDQGLNFSDSRNVNIIKASTENLIKGSKVSIGIGYTIEWSTDRE